MASPMSSMDLDDVQKAYSRWSRVYDVVFGPTFATARRRAVAMLELQPGQRVLEVGVGTGLSFPEFPTSCSAYGIDISRPMLRRAKARTRRPGTGVAEAVRSRGHHRSIEAPHRHAHKEHVRALRFDRVQHR